jgi:tetratricopeptide (TPR) repeat protein
MHEAMRGTLSDGALAPLVGSLQRARATGWLRVSAMELRAGIPSVRRIGLRLREGRVVAVETDAREDLFRTPSAAQAGDLTERATAGIVWVFSSPDAVQSWEPVEEQAAVDASAPWLAALAMRAVERLPDAVAVRAALGHVDRTLVVCPAAEAASALLTSAQRMLLLASIRGGVTAAELIGTGGGEAAERDLLALLCAGAVEWAPASSTREAAETTQRPAARDEAQPPARPDPPTAPPRTKPSTGASAAYKSLHQMPSFTPKGATPAPARVAPPPPSAAERRRDIEGAHAVLRGADHFTVLGLAPGASDAEIRQAFARQARRFHPDSQSDPALEDLGPKLTDLFVAVSNAHEALKDRTARERYERALGFGVSTARPPTAAAPAWAAPGAGAAPDDPIASRLLRAEEALGAGQPWEAIRLLEEALPAAGGPMKVRAQVLLARAYVDRDRPREAEKVLLDILQADPRSLPACLLLGRFYREQGMGKRARGMFERVLEIEPRHAEALREMSSLDSAPPEPRSGGSLLSRLRDRR